MRSLFVLLTLLLLTPHVVLRASETPEGIAFFEQNVRPLLVEKCYSCHSADTKKLKGGLLLDTRQGWERGGDSGKPALIPGDAEASLLIQSVHYEDEQLQMPPKEKLSATQIATLVAWVKMGAPDPRVGPVAEAKRADKSWWSLQPLQEAALPPVEGVPPHWEKSPIDRFIAQKLTEKGLRPNAPAAARDLIRRMTYDLTGLPPTPEEVDAFAKAYSQNADGATTELVDRLLESPHYGERWGRHWLDVVRFGESRGYERNHLVDNAWPFRDYVISSLNADKPFNQFIVEHLAGDVIGRNLPDVETGSAFLVAGPFDDVNNKDVAAQAQIRADTLDDVISATSSAFLGVTMNCARCHHHKFDPIAQEDYYRMRAAFEGVQHGSRVIATDSQREQFTATTNPLRNRVKEVTALRDALEKEVTGRPFPEGTAEPTSPPAPPSLTEESFPSVEARMVRLRILATTADANSGAGARVDEVEVWTGAPNPRNVALASAGGTASGAKARSAEDFKDAYDASLTIDGKFDQRWFAGSPAELTITLPRVERIEKINFSNIRGLTQTNSGSVLGLSVVEYEILISSDGKNWTKVADSLHRKPINDAHLRARKWRFASHEEIERRASLAQQLTAANRELAAVPVLPSVWAGEFHQPKEATFLNIGGDANRRGAEVRPASLSLLDQVAPHYELPPNTAEGQRRLALASWIASDENPLTARVLANRVWHYHFGTGLVDTPSDFGYLGGKPSHPELLDWLALRLQHHGWRLKPLHREIMLSQAYRQSAAFRQDGASIDKSARLLWRFPPRRLGSEELRDTLLHTSGKLDTRMGGSGFRLYRYLVDNVATYLPLDTHPPETWRRAIYHQNARASIADLLSDFDGPDVAFSTPSRASTTTPMQALTLLNHSFTGDMAEALAVRVQAQAGPQPEDQIRKIFSLALQRAPTPEELQQSVKLVQQHGLPAFARAMYNLNEFIYIQ